MCSISANFHVAKTRHKACLETARVVQQREKLFSRWSAHCKIFFSSEDTISRRPAGYLNVSQLRIPGLRRPRGQGMSATVSAASRAETFVYYNTQMLGSALKICT